MKLVKIDENLYLNPNFIEAIEADGDDMTDVTMMNGERFNPVVPIEKVLYAITNSEEM